MPGYVTHYIFGREVYHNLKNNSLRIFIIIVLLMVLDFRDLIFSFITFLLMYWKVIISVHLPMSSKPVLFSRV